MPQDHQLVFSVTKGYNLLVMLCWITLIITRHLFFTYTDLPPGRLTDLRAAAVNNENFTRVAVKHKLLLHVPSSWFKCSRGSDSRLCEGCSRRTIKAPKVLGDIVEYIAGATFLDNDLDTSVVCKVFQPLLQPMVTPETLPMHPVRELQERCQQQPQGLECKASRMGNLRMPRGLSTQLVLTPQIVGGLMNA
ncbi:hypothetical protein KFK09_027971 [Dendrobium nobile]|uniref:RNase III domain-containing protein n=1 Tax=Dendrobium nobile TaxID=94219 RepID=A0A8T3A0U6_DENNO|nr:hypothetical protein KFK09_027971 [Dendrobium nobile]